MFYSLHSIWQFILLGVALVFFVFLSWHKPKISSWLVIFFAPLYLLKISHLPLTVFESLIWILVGVWLTSIILNGRLRELSFRGFCRDFYRPLFLVILGVFLAAIFSPDWRVSFGILKAYFLAPLAFSFAYSNIFKEDGGILKHFFSAVFCSAATVAAISLVFLWRGQLTFDNRLAAFYLSPNHLAMYLAPGLLSGLALWPGIKKFSIKIFLFIACAALLIALYFSFSYGAWLGVGAAILFGAMALWRFKIISRRCFLTVIFSGLLFFFLLAFWEFIGGKSEKLMAIFASPRSSWQSRLMVWRAAWEVLKDNWILGIGPGLFQKYYLAYQPHFSVPYLEWAVPQPHNLFLAWWLQTGLLGLVGFMLLLYQFFKWLKNSLTKTPSWLMACLVAMMALFLTHGLIDTTFWKNDLALVFWLAIFLGYKAGRRAC